MPIAAASIGNTDHPRSSKFTQESGSAKVPLGTPKTKAINFGKLVQRNESRRREMRSGGLPTYILCGELWLQVLEDGLELAHQLAVVARLRPLAHLAAPGLATASSAEARLPPSGPMRKTRPTGPKRNVGGLSRTQRTHLRDRGLS